MSEEVPHTSLIVNLQSLSKQITFNVMKYLNIIKISQVRRLLTDEYETPVMYCIRKRSHRRAMQATCVRGAFCLR